MKKVELNVVLDSSSTTTRYSDARDMVNIGQNLVILGTWKFYDSDESVLT